MEKRNNSIDDESAVRNILDKCVHLKVNYWRILDFNEITNSFI